MLAKVIVREFHMINRVFASHLVAFTAFRMMRKMHDQLDFYSFFRIPVKEVEIPYEEFRETFDRVRDGVIDLFNEGKVDMATHLTVDLDEVIDIGLKTVGMFHNYRPLLKNKQGNIITQDLNNLYYYHNRMDGYELARHVRNTPELKHIPIIMITSRTGEKHRDRAMELGVNQYLGKPFQEAELLDSIHTLLADQAHE